MKSVTAKERGMTWKGRSAKLSNNTEWWWWRSGGKRSAKLSNTMLVGGGGRTGEIEYKQQHGAGGGRCVTGEVED